MVITGANCSRTLILKEGKRVTVIDINLLHYLIVLSRGLKLTSERPKPGA